MPSFGHTSVARIPNEHLFKSKQLFLALDEPRDFADVGAAVYREWTVRAKHLQPIRTSLLVANGCGLGRALVASDSY